MFPAKYFTPKYWARKFFGTKPGRGGAGPQPTAWAFEIVAPEMRGVEVARDSDFTIVLPDVRVNGILRLFRFELVEAEVLGVFVGPEQRGVEA